MQTGCGVKSTEETAPPSFISRKKHVNVLHLVFVLQSNAQPSDSNLPGLEQCQHSIPMGPIPIVSSP